MLLWKYLCCCCIVAEYDAIGDAPRPPPRNIPLVLVIGWRSKERAAGAAWTITRGAASADKRNSACKSLKLISSYNLRRAKIETQRTSTLFSQYKWNNMQKAMLVLGIMKIWRFVSLTNYNLLIFIFNAVSKKWPTSVGYGRDVSPSCQPSGAATAYVLLIWLAKRMIVSLLILFASDCRISFTFLSALKTITLQKYVFNNCFALLNQSFKTRFFFFFFPTSKFSHMIKHPVSSKI